MKRSENKESRTVWIRGILTAVVLASAAVLARPEQQSQQQAPPRFSDRVDVGRVLVDVHVVDDSGQPVRGLTPHDFQVRIDGRAARVEHIRFIAAGAGSTHEPSTPSAGSARVPEARSQVALSPPAASGLPPSSEWTDASGRLIVLVFQRSMEPSRLGGLMLMQARAARFIGTLTASDRIAIAWFDSHLKLAADFTADHARLAAVVRKSVVWATPERLAPGSSPSLAAVFDYGAALRAASIDQGLLVLARALGTVPGPKVVILFGWGFGRLSGTTEFARVDLDNDYGRARAALVAARTSVFSVDVTDAASHSLEAGLQVLAEDTGGDYVRTSDFADAAFDRVARILSAQYELSVEKPDLPRGTHAIEVTVLRRHATVFARKAYTD